ncbi:MAG TPA: M20/M25/M40 family metallo-hydrolase [Vicinamibacterales bacterium]|jgi:acetylornithine deacetylase/succinyl-diaminopimelate desuccinylase-like protein|nr:M20/M25/M40 family metallo-hydrolase [Vicinamibacterales bacterium]
MRSLSFLLLCAALSAGAPAQAPDWSAINGEAMATLHRYVAIDTSNPPGDVTKAADFLIDLLKHEGIDVTRYESAPGRSIVLARLKGDGTGGKAILFESHMDVVPADPRHWSGDPFTLRNIDGNLTGRGSIDMKGIGVAQLYAFIMLHRQHVPLSRDVLLMFVPDEEVGGAMGAAWMRKNHYSDLDPEYVIDEGGFGSRDMFAAGKLVFGVSVAERKIMWLRVRAEGVAGHGSMPHAQNPNEHLMRALNRLLAEPIPGAEFSVIKTLKERVGGELVQNKFTNAIQHSTISLTTLRSGVGDPPKVNVIPPVAEATLDCRVLPGTSASAWVALIQQRLDDPTLKIEIINEGEDPIVTPQDTPLYRAFESAIRTKYPDAIVAPIVIPFGSDANGYRSNGVKAYGLFPGIVPAATILSMHADDEFIPADAVGQAIQIYFEAVRQTAAKQ